MISPSSIQGVRRFPKILTNACRLQASQTKWPKAHTAIRCCTFARASACSYHAACYSSQAMLATCPQCLRKVLPKSDSRCPSCNTLLGVETAEPDQELLTVRERQKFPNLCFHCGQPATSFTMAKFEGAAMGRQVAGRFLLGQLLFSLFGGGAASRAMRGVGGSADSFRIDLPSCQSCTDMDQSTFVRGVNQSARTMDMAVHRDFAAAVRKLA